MNCLARRIAGKRDADARVVRELAILDPVIIGALVVWDAQLRAVRVAPPDTRRRPHREVVLGANRVAFTVAPVALQPVDVAPASDDADALVVVAPIGVRLGRLPRLLL